MDIRITGARDLAEAARAAKKLGDGKEIVSDMRREIRSAVPPFRTEVRQNALAMLPQEGGLNKWVAGTRVRAAIRTGYRSAGVNLVGGRNSAQKRSDIRRIDRGRTRHPLFGNRRHWYLQSLRPGFFSNASDVAVDEFREATVRAINKAVRRVWG